MRPGAYGSRSAAVVGAVLFVAMTCAAGDVPAGGSVPPYRVILDTDGAADYDDIVTVMLCAAMPEVDLLGVVVTCAEPEEHAKTVAKALGVMGRDDVGVYIGERSGTPEPEFPYMSQFPDRRIGKWPDLERWAANLELETPSRSGVQFYLDTVLGSTDDSGVVVITTGPLSTLGTALRRADEADEGGAFRQRVERVLLSGADFETVEYNVYKDIGAGKAVIESGIPVYQFGGEHHPQAYLRHPSRERLWSAATPATWALQDVYRLWRAGWDPRSPFVPILHDTIAAVYLVDDEVCTFEKAAIAVDPGGRLIRTTGPATVYVRGDSDVERAVEFIVERLRGGVVPAGWHLRAARQAASGLPPEVHSAIDSAVETLNREADPASTDLETTLTSLESLAASRGPSGEAAARHVATARMFLFGEHREDPWQDPYTDAWLSVYVPALEVYHGLGLTRKKLAVVAFAFVVLVGFGGYVLVRRRRAARR